MVKTQGSGSIVQLEKDKPKGKCRKWQLRVSTGKDLRTGKYKVKVKTVRGTYTEAKALLREFADEVEKGNVQNRTSWTFREYCDYYIERREPYNEVAATTLVRQRTFFRAASMHIGHANLAAITPAALNDMYLAMLKGDTISGNKASGAYINQIHRNIKLVFDKAIGEGIISSNPCDKANPPKSDSKEKHVLNPDQARLFIAMLDEREEHDMAYLLAITLGLRRGEICGLSWGDVDFDRGLVDIHHSYDALGNLKSTKTKSGTRLLPLTEGTAEALRKHKDAQLKRFDRTNYYRRPKEGYIKQDETTPVIVGVSGERVHPGRLGNWWRADRSKFGLEDLTLHELRHTYLTLLALSGVHPKVMQELAGHYSSQITMDIYTHVNVDAKREAAEAVAKVF